ncbi:MAG: phosphohistidine phosphatase SixA [Planctomycetes bacterium]|nr:phosphohistidine phosphatase SixA [Planctomycetota bacterium]
MIVYIVRHAIAFERDDKKWPDDSERPLTSKGKARFRKIARQLQKLGIGVDHTLSSGFLRAWQTAEILHQECDWPLPEKLTALEPGRSATEAIKALARRDAAALAVVGHEPSLSALLSCMLAGPSARTLGTFKKGGVACVEFNSRPQAGAGQLRWMATPKLLIGDA